MKKNLLKGKALVGFWLVALAIVVSSTPVFGQQASERYPKAAELQRLREKFRQQIQSIQNSNEVRDSRTQVEKQTRESFVRAWSKVDPAVAPFLGNWLGYEEGLGVYPSNKKGRVCLIYIGIQEADLRLGTASNGQIRTDGREVILKEGDYLAVASVRNNKPDIPVETPYHSPTLVKTARELAQLSGANAQEVNKVVREFNAAGCTAMPSRG